MSSSPPSSSLPVPCSTEQTTSTLVSKANRASTTDEATMRQTLQRWKLHQMAQDNDNSTGTDDPYPVTTTNMAMRSSPSTLSPTNPTSSPRRVRKIVGGTSTRRLLQLPPQSPLSSPQVNKAVTSPMTTTTTFRDGSRSSPFVKNERRLSAVSTKFCATLAQAPMLQTLTDNANQNQNQNSQQPIDRRKVMTNRAHARGQSVRGFSKRNLLVGV